jgi:hypothetical protein
VIKLATLNEPLEDIQCGLTFTIGLAKSKKLYYWGKKVFSGKVSISKDVLEPIVMDKFTDPIVSVKVSYNNCLAMTLN